MRWEMFSIWVGLSTGIWLSEWMFGTRNWDIAASATWWIGMAFAWAAYRLRNYRDAS